MEQKTIETNDAVKPQKLTKRQKEIVKFRKEYPKEEILKSIADGIGKVSVGLGLLVRCDYFNQDHFSGYAQTPIDRMHCLIEVLDSEFNEIYLEQD